MTCEGIKANGIHTYTDLGFCIAERHIAPPKIRSIRKTVPFMHGSYDFGMISGETIYEDTEITYTFDIAEFDTREMERQKEALLHFFCNDTGRGF